MLKLACRSTRLAIALTLGLALLGCGDRGADAASESELERLTGACSDAMLKNTCRVMSGPAASDSASVVFIAGIGPVDAKAYRELRASGDAMCATVLDACRRDWAGPQCTTARALWLPDRKPG